MGINEKEVGFDNNFPLQKVIKYKHNQTPTSYKHVVEESTKHLPLHPRFFFICNNPQQ